MTDRINETYRGYALLSAFYKGKHRGRAWLGKTLTHEIEGKSVEGVMLQSKGWVHDVQNGRVARLSHSQIPQHMPMDFIRL